MDLHCNASFEVSASINTLHIRELISDMASVTCAILINVSMRKLMSGTYNTLELSDILAQYLI